MGETATQLENRYPSASASYVLVICSSVDMYTFQCCSDMYILAYSMNISNISLQVYHPTSHVANFQIINIGCCSKIQRSC